MVRHHAGHPPAPGAGRDAQAQKREITEHRRTHHTAIGERKVATAQHRHSAKCAAGKVAKKRTQVCMTAYHSRQFLHPNGKNGVAFRGSSEARDEGNRGKRGCRGDGAPTQDNGLGMGERPGRWAASGGQRTISRGAEDIAACTQDGSASRTTGEDHRHRHSAACVIAQ
jgi:hypothetical protein